MESFLYLFPILNNLIELVKPSNTRERLVTYLYGDRRVRLDLDVAYNNFEEVNKMVYELGKEIGTNDSELKDNLLLINNDYLLGDMNTNGKIDLKDIILLIKTYLGN